MLKNTIKYNVNKGIPSWGLLLLLLLFLAQACSKEEDEPLKLYPNAGPSFIDIENEGYVVQLNAVPVKAPLIGTWRIYNGENGSFENVNDPKSKGFSKVLVKFSLIYQVLILELYDHYRKVKYNQSLLKQQLRYNLKLVQ